MRVLVLGANGQLGKVIVNKLPADGHQITGFLRHLPSEIASGAHIEYFVGDATNEKSVAESLSGRDVVVNAIGRLYHQQAVFLTSR